MVHSNLMPPELKVEDTQPALRNLYDFVSTLEN